MGSNTETIADATCAVLVGGESRRMGSDKALTSFNGSPLLEHVLTIVRPLFSDILICARTDNFSFNDNSIQVVADNLKGRGPAVGLESALKATKTNWVFLLSCDLPFLSGQIIRYLAELRNDEDVIIPITEGRPQPTLALYKRNCHLPLLEALIAGENIGLNSFLKSSEVLKTLYVEEDKLREVDPELKSFIDIDTPEELTEAEKNIKE